MEFSEEQIKELSPDSSSFQLGKGLAKKSQWVNFQQSSRAIWGEIKGSGTIPYKTQMDRQSLAFKCSCPSRKFPCKHGIALLFLKSLFSTDFELLENEPPWVKEWMDKRTQTSNKKEIEPQETTAEVQKSQEKRQNQRQNRVEDGISEVELWLKDFIRTGLIQFPQKDASTFLTMASRLVDAQATGLASGIKQLTKIDFSEDNLWKTKSLQLLSSLYLLIDAYKRKEKLPEIWQTTLKTLVGWNQSPKELLENETAEIISDEWLVVGKERQIEEDLIIERNWLIGLKTNRNALILHFGTKFSPLISPLISGTIFEGKLAFFPSVIPHRAVLKFQNKTISVPLKTNNFNLNSCEKVQGFLSDIWAKNPFIYDIPLELSGFRACQFNKKWWLQDSDSFAIPLNPDFEENKALRLLLLSIQTENSILGIFRNETFLPLGLIIDNQYVIL